MQPVVGRALRMRATLRNRVPRWLRPTRLFPDRRSRHKLLIMSELVTGIRHAKPADAAAISKVFDAAWREAYTGIIPGVTLERMIQRRGPRWWAFSLRRGRPLAVLDVGKQIVGYASYGRCRDRSLKADGEID